MHRYSAIAILSLMILSAAAAAESATPRAKAKNYVVIDIKSILVDPEARPVGANAAEIAGHAELGARDASATCQGRSRRLGECARRPAGRGLGRAGGFTAAPQGGGAKLVGAAERGAPSARETSGQFARAAVGAASREADNGVAAAIPASGAAPPLRVAALIPADLAAAKPANRRASAELPRPGEASPAAAAARGPRPAALARSAKLPLNAWRPHARSDRVPVSRLPPLAGLRQILPKNRRDPDRLDQLAREAPGVGGEEL